ncbi:MAG: hypothetical protein ACRERR_14960 [Moraxellaceae bacterium]
MKNIALLSAAIFLSSCKVVNTHVFKVTSTPVPGAEVEVKIATTKGYLFLPTAALSEKEIGMLKDVRPFQCISIRTSESFEMNNREVRFSDFKMKKLPESDAECRKIKATTRIYGS